MMDSVPAYVSPKDLPERVMSILKLVGNAGRAQVLHVLSANKHDGLSASDISEKAGVPYRTCWLYLQALEELNLVSASVPPGPERHGRRDIIWVANSQDIREALEQFTQFLLAEE